MSFQKCSDNGVFWCACTFWLGHVLRAALFSNSTSKSGPSMGCFWHFDFEMCFAPQRQVLMSHLPGWLRTRRFTVASLLFPFRAPWSSFYTDLLATDSFSSGSFSSLPLPTSAVSSVHTVGSLTSKLLSTIYTTCPLVPSSKYTKNYGTFMVSRSEMGYIHGAFSISSVQVFMVPWGLASVSNFR